MNAAVQQTAVAQAVNDYLLLLMGPSATGKSASLRNLRDPEGVMYLNTEAGKKLPFPAKFAQFTITNPLQVIEAFNVLAANDYVIDHPQLKKKVKIHTVVVDSLTFLLDMYESQFVLPSQNTMKAWGDFAQFFKDLMQAKVAQARCNVIFIAHTLATLNENEMVMEVKVPVKGSLKNNGIEAYFSCAIAVKKVPTKRLEDYKSNLLDVTEEDQALGFKHVFQTKLTKDTVNERIRAPMAMFSTPQTYMDNDVQKLLDHIHAYYQ